MTRTVYLASPLSAPNQEGIERNQAYARAAMRDSLGRGEAPFVPHLLYTQVLDDTRPLEREAGMRAGTAVLLQCDALVAYIDRGISRGMQAEIDLATAHGIPVEERRLPVERGNRNKSHRERWICIEPGCGKTVPYTDWTRCEEHNSAQALGVTR